jgi:hypothetical protein
MKGMVDPCVKSDVVGFIDEFAKTENVCCVIWVKIDSAESWDSCLCV